MWHFSCPTTSTWHQPSTVTQHPKFNATFSPSKLSRTTLQTSPPQSLWKSYFCFRCINMSFITRFGDPPAVSAFLRDTKCILGESMCCTHIAFQRALHNAIAPVSDGSVRAFSYAILICHLARATIVCGSGGAPATTKVQGNVRFFSMFRESSNTQKNKVRITQRYGFRFRGSFFGCRVRCGCVHTVSQFPILHLIVVEVVTDIGYAGL